MEEIIKKAEILIEALPYIKKFRRKIFVIKYGGSVLEDEKIRHSILKDIVFLSFTGIHSVLVHGGSKNINRRLSALGKKSEFFNGLRITDKQTLKIVDEELNKLNAMLVREINELDGRAIGLRGREKKLILTKKKRAPIDLGFVGEIARINKKIILEKLNDSSIAVVSPMGRGADGKVYNVNADEAVSKIASAVRAEKLVFLTDVKGIMTKPHDPNSFLPTLSAKRARVLIKNNIIQTGMIPKVEACIHSLDKGIKKAHIINAGLPHGLLLEIFTDKGIGTEIIK